MKYLVTVDVVIQQPTEYSQWILFNCYIQLVYKSVTDNLCNWFWLVDLKLWFIVVRSCSATTRISLYMSAVRLTLVNTIPEWCFNAVVKLNSLLISTLKGTVNKQGSRLGNSFPRNFTLRTTLFFTRGKYLSHLHNCDCK